MVSQLDGLLRETLESVLGRAYPTSRGVVDGHICGTTRHLSAPSHYLEWPQLDTKPLRRKVSYILPEIAGSSGARKYFKNGESIQHPPREGKQDLKRRRATGALRRESRPQGLLEEGIRTPRTNRVVEE